MTDTDARQQPFDFSSYITERTRNFTGREWVFAKIERWLGDPKRSHVFLLTGNPGTGKSAVMARLAQISLEEVDVPGCSHLKRGFLSHLHFCQANKDATLSPLRYVEALSQSLANQYEPFRAALLKQNDRDININVQQTTGNVANGGQITGVIIKNLHISNLNSRAAFDRAVRVPLEALCSTDLNNPIVFLVDSLEAALSWGEDDNIAALLAGAFGKSGNLPPQVCVTVASRPDEQIEKWYGKPTLDLAQSAPSRAHDIEGYIYQRLTGGSVQERRVMARRLDRAAKGNFLYACYALENMTSSGELPKLPALTRLPKDLNEIYRTFIQNHLAKSQKQWKQVRPLLGALVVARDDGLTRAQLHGIMDLFKELTADETDDLLSACSQYLSSSQPDGPFYIYHRSFGEFLYHSTEFCIYPAEANQAIADFFLQAYGSDWLSCKDEYALRYTLVHLKEAASVTLHPEAKLVHDRIGSKLAALEDDANYRSARIRTFSKGELTPGVEAFVSRVASNSAGPQWVLQRLNDWLQAPESRHFLIIGEASTGKTALAARLWQISRGVALIDELQFPYLTPGFLTYAHFCQSQDQTSLDPLDFLEGLSRMLIYRYKDYARLYATRVTSHLSRSAGRAEGGLTLDLPAVTIHQKVQETDLKAKISGVVINRLLAGDPRWPVAIRHALDQIEVFNGVNVREMVSRFRDLPHAAEALLEPLSQLSRENPRLRVVILLDGLDAAVQQSGNTLLYLLRLMDRLPEQVGFVLLSRPVPEVVNALGPAQIDLDQLTS